jgi:EmrB/QacA subfamily drug resistance transporter
VADNWRYVFFVNLPFGVIAFLLTLAVVPESKDRQARHRLDAAGVILSSLAVFALTWGFIEGPRYGWWRPTHALVIGGVTVRPLGLSVVPLLFAGAAALAAGFVLYERRRRAEPLVDLSLFRVRNYSVGMVTGVILNFALMGAMFLLPLYGQAVLGIDPLHMGTLMLPFAFALLVVSPLAGILSDRIGGRPLLVAGLVILAVSDLLIARFRVDTRMAELILPFAVMGVGMGLSMTPLTNLTLYGVPAAKAGGASGLISTMRQIGAVMGVAIFSVALQGSMGTAIQAHVADVKGLPAAAAAGIVGYVKDGGLYGMSDSGSSALGGSSMPKEMADGIQRAMKQTFTDGVNDTFRIAALVGVAAVLVSLLMSGHRRPALSVARGSPAEAAARAPGDDQDMAAGE